MKDAMPREPVPAHDAAAAPGHPDDAERAVLECVVDLHPIQLTIDELIRELTDTPDDFASRDQIEITVQQLARVGLLHCHGRFVLPSRALLRVLELGIDS
jgi:hypothetical protein